MAELNSSRFSFVAARRRYQRGFTLIELVMVIVMLGVLAVFAAPRLFNSGDFDARGFRDETLSLLRFAQKTAIGQRRTVCVTLNATGVVMAIDTDTPPDGTCNSAPALPNSPRGGSGLAGSVTNFEFTPLGSTNQSANVVIGITGGNNILVEASTGYVHD